MTDYELVYKLKTLKIENCKTKYYYELYNRYKPMMNKFYRELKPFKLKLDSSSQEDYMQDCYFVLIKAVNYIKLSKIVEKETWKFQNIFWYYLKQMNTRNRTLLYRKPINENEIYYSKNFEEDYKEKLSDIVCSESPEDILIHNQRINKLKDVLYELKNKKPFKYDILKAKVIEGKKLNQIMKEKNIKHIGSVYFHLNFCIEYLHKKLKSY